MVSLSPPITGRIALRAPAPAELIAPLACLAVFALALFDPRVLADGDSWWHLAAGRWILAHGRAPSVDPFSFTHAGQPWLAHEWLSEALMALAFRLAGWGGVLVLSGAALALTAGLLARALGRRLSGVALAVTLTLGLALGAGSILARPHLLAAPLLVVWLDGLLQARAAGRAPPLWMAALMALWANLHGSFVFGFLLAAPLALEAILAARPRPWPAVRAWAVFGAASLLAGLATPHGVSAYLYPLQITGMETLGAITEWRPQDFAQPGLFELVLMAALFAAMTRGVRAPPLRMALLLVVLHMALQHHRHELVLGLVAPLLLAEPLAEALGAAPGRPAWTPAALAIAAAGLVVLAGLRLAAPIVRTDGVNAPASALAHVPTTLRARPVLNSYGFGGYLIFQGVRPFIDGRSDMYGDGLFRTHIAMIGGDLSAFDAATRRYGLAWTLLKPEEPLARALEDHRGWRELYRDRWAVAFVRTAEPAAN